MHIVDLASYPVPHPAFRRLQYRTASDGKLGVGLRMRLWLANSSTSLCGYIRLLFHCTALQGELPERY